MCLQCGKCWIQHPYSTDDAIDALDLKSDLDPVFGGSLRAV